MSMCPKCGKSNRDGQRFCTACGAKLLSPPFESRAASVPPRKKDGQGGLIAAIVLVITLIVLVSSVWLVRILQRNEASSSSIPNGTLMVGSHWYGTMQFSNYKGSRDLAGDTLAVEGYIGQESDGKCYFELTQRNSASKSTLMSFYINLYPDHFEPAIQASSKNDNWIMDVLLSSSDIGKLQIYPNNGVIEFNYAYDIGSVSCSLSVTLSGSP